MTNQRLIVRPKRRAPALFERSSTVPSFSNTDRDTLVLRLLACHRYLKLEQINRLAFQVTPRRARHRMRVLFDAKLVDRVKVVAQPSQGVPNYLYQLTKQGADVIAEQLEGPVHVPSLRSRSLRFVAHHVQVCDIFVALSEALALRREWNQSQPWQLLEWLHDWHMKDSQPHGPPRAVRVSIPNNQGGTRSVTVLPDAFVVVGQPDGVSYRFFIELDRSNHGLKKWRERARAYVEFARPGRGLFRQRFGHGRFETFRLLVITPADYRRRSRCNNVLDTIQREVGVTSLFLGATLPELHPPITVRARTQRRIRDQAPQPSAAIFGPIWRQLGTQRRCTLLPTVYVQQ